MFERIALVFVLYLITYVIHSSLLLTFTYSLQRFGLLNPARHTRFSELIWRVAYFGGFITAAIHLVVASSTFSPISTSALVDDSKLKYQPAIEKIQSEKFNSANSELSGSLVDEKSAPIPMTLPIPDLTLPQSISLPPYLSTIAVEVFFVWLIFALAVVLHLTWQLRNLNRLAHHGRVEEGSFLIGVHQFIAEHFPKHYRRLQLRISAEWHSPMVIPNGIICLPLWMIDKLSHAQQRAVLAHEIAHVVRKDTIWSIAYVLVLRLFFFQILNRMAYTQLRNVAELACDARASKTAQAHDLAKALYVCATQMRDRTTPDLILAANPQGSTLEQRVRCLLEQHASSDHKAKNASIARMILSGIGIFGVLLSATFATPVLQVSSELLKIEITSMPKSESKLKLAPLPHAQTIDTTFDLNSKENRNQRVPIIALKNLAVVEPKHVQDQVQDKLSSPATSQVESQDLIQAKIWEQAELAYAQQDYQKAAQLFTESLASGRAEAQNRLNQIHARLKKQAEIDTYLTDFPADEYRLTAKKCPPPENLTASSIRSQNLKTLKQINDWENCYNQFVEQLQQRFERSPLVPQELASLMTDAELARANQVLKQTYQRIGAEAQAQLKPIQATFAKWQAERARAEELAQESSQRIRRVSSLMTPFNAESKAFEGTTYANGRPLSWGQESKHVTDEFGWQHRGQTHAVDESLNKKSQEK
jgi:beta-lactamase regulating signal transducer with metallopeptidase domain